MNLNQHRLFTAALLAFLLLADTAFAQGFGGGGGSFMSGIVNYVTNNVVPTLAILAVIAGSFVLAYLRMAGLAAIGFAAAGIYIASNASTFVSYMR